MYLNENDFLKIEDIKNNSLTVWIMRGDADDERVKFDPDGEYGGFDIFTDGDCLYIRHDGGGERLRVYFDGAAASDIIGSFGIVELMPDNSFEDKGRFAFPDGKNCVVLEKNGSGGVSLDFIEYRVNSATPEDDIKTRIENLRGNIKADLDIISGVNSTQSALISEYLKELEELASLVESGIVSLIEQKNALVKEHLNG